MKGPFGLTIKNIHSIKKEPGVYILGAKNPDGSLWGCYVGRSDEDISNRISHWFNLINGIEFPKGNSERCIISNKMMDMFVMIFIPQKPMLVGFVLFAENK